MIGISSYIPQGNGYTPVKIMSFRVALNVFFKRRCCGVSRSTPYPNQIWHHTPLFDAGTHHFMMALGDFG